MNKLVCNYIPGYMYFYSFEIPSKTNSDHKALLQWVLDRGGKIVLEHDFQQHDGVKWSNFHKYHIGLLSEDDFMLFKLTWL